MSVVCWKIGFLFVLGYATDSLAAHIVSTWFQSVSFVHLIRSAGTWLGFGIMTMIVTTQYIRKIGNARYRAGIEAGVDETIRSYDVLTTRVTQRHGRQTGVPQ